MYGRRTMAETKRRHEERTREEEERKSIQQWDAYVSLPLAMKFGLNTLFIIFSSSKYSKKLEDTIHCGREKFRASIVIRK